MTRGWYKQGRRLNDVREVVAYSCTTEWWCKMKRCASAGGNQQAGIDPSTPTHRRAFSLSGCVCAYEVLKGLHHNFKVKYLIFFFIWSLSPRSFSFFPPPFDIRAQYGWRSIWNMEIAIRRRSFTLHHDRFSNSLHSRPSFGTMCAMPTATIPPAVPSNICILSISTCTWTAWHISFIILSNRSIIYKSYPTTYQWMVDTS